MKRVSLSLLIAAFVAGTALTGPAAAKDPSKTACPAKKKIPVILDTDIGGDIDDTWALVLMLNSPELDIKLVTTATGNTTYRAKVVAKILEVAKRTDIPVGIGIRENNEEQGQAPWVKDYDLCKYPGKVYEDGVGAIVKTIMESEEPITLIAIGPLPNVAAALEKEPKIAKRAKFVGMHGSVRRGYRGSSKPSAEYNVKQNAKACQKVFTAPWRITITPLDTCGIVHLDHDRYVKVAECPDPLAKALVENYLIWCKGEEPQGSSILFDTVAIYLAFTKELLKMEYMGIRVTDKGMTVADKEAKVMNCAMEWKDLGAFEDLIVKRITSAAYLQAR